MLRISRASQFCLDSMISISSSFFFFNDTATTEIYTLSLHDALPISRLLPKGTHHYQEFIKPAELARWLREADMRSEEHTSELQSQSNLVCRLLLEKKKKSTTSMDTPELTSCAA